MSGAVLETRSVRHSVRWLLVRALILDALLLVLIPVRRAAHGRQLARVQARPLEQEEPSLWSRRHGGQPSAGPGTDLAVHVAPKPPASAGLLPSLGCPPVDACPVREPCTDVHQSVSLDSDGDEALLGYKVYVYDLPAEFNSELKENVKGWKRCLREHQNGHYTTEAYVHEALLISPVRTLDPSEADLFYVPVYGECKWFTEAKLKGEKDARVAVNQWFLRALAQVRQQWVFWNRTEGRDHVWAFPGAKGPHLFHDWRQHIRESIFLTPEAVGYPDTPEQYDPWKDVLIPGLENLEAFWSGALRAEERPRPTLAYFKGTVSFKGGAAYSGGVRSRLQAALRGQEGATFTKGPRPGCDRRCYAEEMARSVFCLCPRGWESWNVRVYQALMAGCIPVILSDRMELPFANDIDWKAVTVRIAEADADRTLEILREIPDNVVKRMQGTIAQVWRMVTYPSKAQPGDAFHGILRELGRKRRASKNSPRAFWTN